MCYNHPGPRCSAHVKDRLERIAESRQQVESTIAELEKIDDEDLDSKTADKLARQRKMLAGIKNAQIEAEEQWKTTPEGLHELEQLYAKMTEVGEGKQADRIRSQWEQGKATRDAQLKAIKASEELKKRLSLEGERNAEKLANAAKEQSRKNKYILAERHAAIKTWNESLPPGYRPVKRTTQDNPMDGADVRVTLHGDIRAEVAKEAFLKAGNNAEGITFIDAPNPVPPIESMPYVSSTTLERQIESGEVSLNRRKEFYASTASNPREEGKGVRINFVNGLVEPTVVRRDGANDNSEPEMILLPGSTRTLTHEESLTIANAIDADREVYLRNRRGAHLDKFDRGQVHGAITRKNDVDHEPARRTGSVTGRVRESITGFLEDFDLA